MKLYDDLLANGLNHSSTTLLHGLFRVSLPSNHPSSFSIKTTGKVKGAVISSEDDLLSFTNGNAPLSNGSLIDDQIKKPLHVDFVSLGTLAADSAAGTANGFVAKMMTMSWIYQHQVSLQSLRPLKIYAKERENEGDLVMAAQLATLESMAFIVKHGTGIVCVSMKDDDLERLYLPLMVNQKENEEKLSIAITVTVDAKHGTTIGVSARDRATTILSLASRDSKPESKQSQSKIIARNMSNFILAGQSNMAGRGGVYNDTATNTTVWDALMPPECRSNLSILRLTAKLKWVEAIEPLHVDIDVNKTNGIGARMSFANRVVNRFGQVGLVPCSVGGTKLSQWQKGEHFYEETVKRAKAAVASSGGGSSYRAVL